MPAASRPGGVLLHALRYGENPHQRGALYALPGPAAGVAHARQLQGPALSFTNWLDVDAARRLVAEFEEPAACVIKHTNPCGFAVGDDAARCLPPRARVRSALRVRRHRRHQPRRRCARPREQLATTFLEALVCPGVEDDAPGDLGGKQRLRVLVVDRPSRAAQLDVRSVDGGLLVQTQDQCPSTARAMTVAGRRAPEEREWH